MHISSIGSTMTTTNNKKRVKTKPGSKRKGTKSNIKFSDLLEAEQEKLENN